MQNQAKISTITLPKCRYWSEGDARLVLDQLSQSGESLTAFAKRHGLVPQRLSRWRLRLSQQKPINKKPGLSAQDAGFIPVVVRPSPSPTPVLVEIGALRIQVQTLEPSSATWVAALAQALGAVP